MFEESYKFKAFKGDFCYTKLMVYLNTQIHEYFHMQSKHFTPL